MIELEYHSLPETLREEAATLLDGCEDPWKDALFVLAEGGELMGMRMPEMYNGARPVKWGKLLGLDLKPVDVARGNAELPLSPAAAVEVGLPTVMLDPALLEFSETNEGREDCSDLVATFAEIGWRPEVSRALVRRVGKRLIVVAGERRVRAAREVGLAEIPCVVVEMSDAEACEIQLLENLQRKDLNAFQVADHLARLVAMGATIDELVAKTGRTDKWVGSMLRVARILPGEAARKAGLGVAHLFSLVRIADPEVRDAVVERAKAQPGGEAMSVAAMTAMIQAEFLKPLAEAPFDTKSASLFPEGGACKACEHNSQNSERGKAWCLAPWCYDKKSALARAEWEAMQSGAGRRVMSADEEKKVWGEDGRLMPSSRFVRLDAPPDEYDLAPGAEPRPWEELVGDSAEEVLVARDPQTKAAVLMMPRDLAKTAAVAAGHRIFRDMERFETPEVRKAVNTLAERKAETLAEKAGIELARRIYAAELRELMRAADEIKQPGHVLRMAAEMGVKSLMHTGMTTRVAALLGCPEEVGPADFLEAQSVELDTSKHPALIAKLWVLTTEDVILNTPPGTVARRDAAKPLGADLDAARRAVENAWKAEQKAAAEAAKPAVEWSDSRRKAADFEWSAEGLCVNAVTLTAGAAVVRVARAKKGWRFATGQALPADTGTSYGTRELAAAAGLKELRQACAVGSPECEALNAAIAAVEKGK